MTPRSASGLQEPVDSAKARALIEEATTALVNAPGLRGNSWAVRAINRLREGWGLPENTALRELAEQERAPARSPFDSLLQAGSLEDLVAAVRSAGDYHARIQSLFALYPAMLSRGEFEAMLALGDIFEDVAYAAYSLLNWTAPEAPLPEARIELVKRHLANSTASTRQRDEIWSRLAQYIGKTDFWEAWAFVDSIRDPGARVFLQRDLLTQALHHDLPGPDSALREVHAELLAHPDADRRRDWLAIIGVVCLQFARPVCDELEFPVPDGGLAQQVLSWRIGNSLGRGDLEDATEAAGLLGTLISRGRLAALVLSRIEEAGRSCAYADGGCGPDFEAWTKQWLAVADSFVRAAPGPLADSIGSILVRFHAVRRTPEAFAAAERIGLPELRRAAYADLGQALVPVNVPAAWRALRAAGKGYANDGALSTLFELFNQFGDTAAAAEAAELISDSGVRVWAELAWADRIAVAGLRDRARELAFAALDRWKPAESPMMLMSIGQFAVFHRLGLYEELIAWARARPDQDDRAAALLAVASNP